MRTLSDFCDTICLYSQNTEGYNRFHSSANCHFKEGISGLTQAEGTGTWTFIGEIYIDIIVYFIENRHFFFHNAAFLSVCF